MNATTSRPDFVPSARYAEHYAADRARRTPLLDRIAAFFQRQSTLRELQQLTDRELADIGLQRAELGRAFDPAFMAARLR